MALVADAIMQETTTLAAPLNPCGHGNVQ